MVGSPTSYRRVIQRLPAISVDGFALARVYQGTRIAAGDLPDRVRVSDDEICIEPAVLPREVRAGH